MNDTVSIIGCGQTAFGEWWDKGVTELMHEAIDKALADAPCTSLDIDMIVVANMLSEKHGDQAHLGALASAHLPHRPPALRVEAACASGSVAVHTAMSLLESGRAENVLVVGVEKMTDASNDEVAEALMGAADAAKDAPHGLTFPGLFGMVTMRYMHEYGLTREQLNIVSARHHENAVNNPFAQFRSAVSPEAVGRSAKVADPLRLLDCSPVSDGAAACVLSKESAGGIRIRASQMANDSLSLSDRVSTTSFAATKDAMERALEEAKIDRTDISCIELHDCFSIAAVINLEDMGFSKPGRGIDLYREPIDDLTINASGGLKACGHPVAATGIKQLIDTSKQLKNTGSRYGLTHNFGGIGATCCIHVLEHDDA